MEQAREEIAPELICAQQVQVALLDPEQMYVGLNESPHFIRIAFDEEAYRPRVACIFLHLEQKRLGIHSGSQGIGEGTQMEFAFGIHEVQSLWTAMQVIGGADCRSVRR